MHVMVEAVNAWLGKVWPRKRLCNVNVVELGPIVGCLDHLLKQRPGHPAVSEQGCDFCGAASMMLFVVPLETARARNEVGLLSGKAGKSTVQHVQGICTIHALIRKLFCNRQRGKGKARVVAMFKYELNDLCRQTFERG